MSIANDIPQDVWKQAEDLFMELRDAGGHDIPVIARAILAERARNAKVADDHVWSMSQWGPSGASELQAGNNRARDIAAAIRKGD